jgi:signal transduction histidine kinase/CheY-like chemotaxis protein
LLAIECDLLVVWAGTPDRRNILLEAPVAANEADRIAAVRALNILDSLPDGRFDLVTRLATHLLDVPISIISLIDVNRQWFKSCLGLPDTEFPRSISFCAYTILGDDPFVIPDTLADPRFADNPLVTGAPDVRFYAGLPLHDAAGFRVGTLSILDRRPRELSPEDLQTLKELAVSAEEELHAIEQSREYEAERKRTGELLRSALLEQRTLSADDLTTALEIQRGETNAILDATSEAMVMVGPNRRLLRANSRFAEMFGIPLNEVLGRSFDGLQDRLEKVFKDAGVLLANVTGTASDPERQFTTDLVQIWPEQRELYLYSAPVHTASKRFIGRLYVFRDVSKERAADRAKSEFVSMVSHELRTPLTSIKGYVDLILDGDAGEISEEQQDYLTIVKNNTDRLVALINDLLDVSRIEQGRIELNREPVDLGGSIQIVATSMKPLLEEKSQELTLDVPADLPPVFADSARVTQILSNLLSNAYKYTPSGGHITMAASPEPGWVSVSVQDNGIGLTREDQEKLFTRFFRANNSTTREVGGTGLGLTITRSLVTLHGGQITVASAPGAGSTFSFTLPQAAVPAQDERRTTIDESSDPSSIVHRPSFAGSGPIVGTDVAGAGKTLLVVDDEPDIANLIRRYFEKAGYSVEIAHTANEAYRLARELHPDLITLDISLPDTDGFTVLEWLKNDPSTAQIPVVVLSVIDDSARGKLLGAVDYLRKPIQEDALVERVGAILEGHEAACVLVADDNADTRALISRHLRGAGYEVVEVSDGSEALEVAHSRHINLALLGIRLQNIDGIEVLRQLRQEPGTRNIPVVMMTTSASVLHEKEPEIKALGGLLIPNEPRPPEEMASAIEQMLHSSGAGG